MELTSLLWRQGQHFERLQHSQSTSLREGPLELYSHARGARGTQDHVYSVYALQVQPAGRSRRGKRWLGVFYNGV